MELRDALTQIAEIRLRVAETELFRGYRALPVAASGALAILAALMQPMLVPDATADPTAYLKLWLTVAALSIAINVISLALRYHLATNSLAREGIRLAVTQFAPCVLAGALLTCVLARYPDQVALLPGLWQIIFSLGLFASCRLLPPTTFLIAVGYLACGVLSLALSHQGLALSPWLMGLPFGAGQLLTAAMLYCNFERHNEQTEPRP